jgi:hypothetical protein
MGLAERSDISPYRGIDVVMSKFFLPLISLVAALSSAACQYQPPTTDRRGTLEVVVPSVKPESARPALHGKLVIRGLDSALALSLSLNEGGSAGPMRRALPAGLYSVQWQPALEAASGSDDALAAAAVSVPSIALMVERQTTILRLGGEVSLRGEALNAAPLIDSSRIAQRWARCGAQEHSVIRREADRSARCRTTPGRD